MPLISALALLVASPAATATTVVPEAETSDAKALEIEGLDSVAAAVSPAPVSTVVQPRVVVEPAGLGDQSDCPDQAHQAAMELWQAVVELQSLLQSADEPSHLVEESLPEMDQARVMEFKGLIAAFQAGPTLVAAVEPETEPAFTLEIALASAYADRGANVFMMDRQSDRHGVLAPAFMWEAAPGLELAWWGAFQTSGDNIAALVSEGVGHEQDLGVNYSFDLVPETLSVGAGTAFTFFPFADPDVAGVAVPSVLEPGIGIEWSGPVTVGLAGCYGAGLQAVTAEGNSFYTEASASTSRQITEFAAWEAGIHGGYKAMRGAAGTLPDNALDLGVDWSVGVDIADGFGMAPGVHLMWTNLDGVGAGEESFVWWDLVTTAVF